MNTYGLMPKFKVNRPLNRDEKEQLLYQNERVGIPNEKLRPGISVIKINSTYLEVVDKYSTTKGVYTLLATVGALFFGFLWLMIINSILRLGTDYWTILIVSAIFSPIIFLLYYIMKHECFLKTHYPIRFNRKTRMVYAYRVDGTIISTSWDDIYFTSGLWRFKTPMEDYYLSGHVLSEDRQTVIDTFCLPESLSIQSELTAHWEFIRRYMEEGVEPVIDSIKYYLPIDKRKETIKEIYLYLLGLAVNINIIFLPLATIGAVPICLTRHLAIRCSQRPIWPDDIEAICQIDPNDSFQRDSSFNTKPFWKTVISLQNKF